MKKILILVLIISYAHAYGEIPKKENQSEYSEETEFEYIKELKKREKPIPMTNTAKFILQPIIGACFAVPWIIYISKNENYDHFLSKNRKLEIGLVATTPLAMSLSISIAGWLLDGRSYNVFTTIGLSTSFSYLGASLGTIVPGVFVAIFILFTLNGFKTTENFNVDAFNVATIISANIFAIIGAVAGSFLSVLIARKKRIPIQGAFINGIDRDVSFALPLPSVSMRQSSSNKIENFISIDLVHYKF